ncbi:MAG: ABC transporter ATP-binding protein [Phycicoccus sp.]|nr:ABC transporter ATP-binding protein [Phycicoccus sp.]
MLRIEHLGSGYGSLPVIRDFSFAPKPGEITLLLGANGAGKTTLMRTIAGFIKPTAGTIEFDGRSLVGLRPDAVAKQGLRLVLEGHRIFPDLSVQDNIRLGQLAVPRSEQLTDADMFERAFEVFPVLGDKRSLPASGLSGGQQQMLALVQAWISNPKILMCDEPSLGLSQALIPDILTFLRARADEGMTVVLVEQLVKQPLAVADRVVFVRAGSVLLEGPPEQFADAEYVGRLLTGQEGAA